MVTKADLETLSAGADKLVSDFNDRLKLKQQQDADAKLRQLLQVQAAQQQQEAIEMNRQRAIEEAKRRGLLPDKYSSSVSEGGYSVNPESDTLGLQIARGLQSANITGHTITDPLNVMPTRQDAEKVKASSQAVKLAQKALPGIKQAVGGSEFFDRLGTVKLGPLGSYGTEKGRNLEQKKAELIGFAQKLQETGVLQPGEIPILERRIGEMTGLSSMFRNPADIEKQIDDVYSQLRNRAESDAAARGYSPIPGYLDAPPSGPRPPSGDSLSGKRQRVLELMKKARGN